MNCQHCGAAVVQSAAFCQACGKPTAVAAASPAADPGKQKFTDAVSRLGAVSDREEVLWEGRFSKLAMIGAWVGAGALTLAAVVAGAVYGLDGRGWGILAGVIALVWVVLFLRLLYLQYTVSYALTNQRFVHERGLLWRQVDRIETIDIDDVTVTQGPVQRMLGIGNVHMVSSDRSTPRFHLVGIEDARRVATIIDEARRTERRKRGVHIEQV